jgi:hypothetical protein
MGSKATTTNFSFLPKFFLFTTHSVCGKKTINLRNQGSFDKKFDFFPRHIARWVRLVQKTRAKNSHAWAPLNNEPSYFYSFFVSVLFYLVGNVEKKAINFHYIFPLFFFLKNQ